MTSSKSGRVIRLYFKMMSLLLRPLPIAVLMRKRVAVTTRKSWFRFEVEPEAKESG